MNRYKSFFKKSIIFSLSSIGSKAATLALVPMYSFSLSLAEFGEVDIALTLIMLLMPILTGSLYEAVQKYSITGSDNREDILSSGLFSFLIVAAVVGVVLIFINSVFVFDLSEKLLLLYLILVFISIYEFFARFAKGTGNELNFALSNILVAITLLSSNFVLVYKGGAGIEGVLMSQVLAYIMGVSFLYFKLRLSKYLSYKYIDSLLLKKMFKLSAPLMLNAAMWWVFDVSDRLLILYFEGASSVGLYSVAYKLAAVILLVHTILFQAWQISAIEHKNDSERSDFYANISEIYLVVIFTCASALIFLNKMILESALSTEYAEAWVIGNFLFVATAFFCLASFFGVFYVVFEKTSRALHSSIIAAVLNIGLNLVLIPKFGILGAAIATVLSTFALLSYRVVDIQRLCRFEFKKGGLFISVMLLTLQVYFAANGMQVCSAIILFSFLIILLGKIKFKFYSLVR